MELNLSRKFVFFFLIFTPIIFGFFGQAQAQNQEATEKRWEGYSRFTTTKGLPCVSTCEKRNRDYYWCYTVAEEFGFTDEQGGWARCSPNPNTDTQGYPCSNECEANYNGDYWCFTNNHQGSGICGKTLDLPEPVIVAKHKSRFGDYCVTNCEKYQGYEYNWCSTANGGAEKCSTQPGHDVYGRKCRSNSICDFHGENYTYTWCELEMGGWDFCGNVEIDSVTEFTVVGSKCLTPCNLKEATNFTMCSDATKRERHCSVVRGVTSEGRECQGTCGYKGDGAGGEKSESYTWCWTDSAKLEWGYCSRPKSDSERNSNARTGSAWTVKSYFPKSGIRQQQLKTGFPLNLYEHRDEQGNNDVVFFESMPRNGAKEFISIKENPEMVGVFKECLQGWRNASYNISSERGNAVLVRSGEGVNALRLEQVLRYTDNTNKEYINIQMRAAREFMRSHGRGRSPTVAEVDVAIAALKKNPEDAVKSLLISLHEGFAVHVGRFRYREQSGSRRRNSSN